MLILHLLNEVSDAVLNAPVMDVVADLADKKTKGPKLPKPGDVDLPGGLNTKLGTLMGWGLRLGYVACFFGFIMAGVKLFQGYRQGGEINFQALGAVAAACLVIGSAGALADMLIF